MKRSAFAKAALFALLALFAMPGAAWIRVPATTFAVMPQGTAHPEGVTVDAQGNVWVADFDVSKSGGPGNIVAFDRSGKLLQKFDVQGASNLLLGIAFHPQTGALLVCDLGQSAVLKVDPKTSTATVFAAIPGGGGPNALAFDAQGNVYISDSFQSTIWKTSATGGSVTPWAQSPLLGTTGVPGFGANGIAFNKAGSAMFVANTGEDLIVKIPVSGGDAGTPEALVYSVNGADGLTIDENDNLWVAANQSDEIVVLDPTGRVLAKLGDFDGVDRRGSPRGLLFPASLAFGHGFVYVTNLALDLRVFPNGPQTTNSQWSAEVTRHTVARIRALIPPVHGND